MDAGLKLVIRKATNKDTKEIVNLISKEYSFESKESFRKRTLDDLKRPDDRFLCVATIENIVVGYARARVINDDKAPYPAPLGWYLMGVLVAPEFRKRGIARRLTEFRLNWLKNKTKEIFYVTNISNKASIHLHKEFKFKKISRAKGFYNVYFKQEDSVLFVLHH